MKWYWLGAQMARVDVFLLHDDIDGNMVRLPRFEKVARCRGCEKFDEEELIRIGFDTDRLVSMPQDILSEINDLPQKIVSEQFRQVCEKHRIKGVKFIPCGRSRRRGAVYLLWPSHESPCSLPPSHWRQGQNYDHTNPAPVEYCHRCGRPRWVGGFPPLWSLSLPDELTITVPAGRTECRIGRSFLFMCSDTVRQIFKAEKLKGCSFCEMERLEKRMAHHQAVRAEIEARKASESRHEESS